MHSRRCPLSGNDGRNCDYEIPMAQAFSRHLIVRHGIQMVRGTGPLQNNNFVYSLWTRRPGYDTRLLIAKLAGGSGIIGDSISLRGEPRQRIHGQWRLLLHCS